ncbi:MAG: hypothetical protein HOP08_04490 [Cyclobacteriaceae bacterium]|nr:hypothetical protein [Cyclobacteriaceae bacterium]
MTTNTIALEKDNQNKLTGFKSAQSLANWEAAAREELNGADPVEKLMHQGKDWVIKPFYVQDQNPPSPLLPVSTNDFLGARTWYNCPLVQVRDPKESNFKALEYLRAGADGILFELNSPTDFNTLLNEIEWKYCSLNFIATAHQQVLSQGLNTYISQNKTENISFHGAFFGNTPLPIKNSEFRFSGFQFSESSSPVEEIETIFKDILKDSRDGSLIDFLAISITIGTDFYLTIAKLRAMRMVWKKYLDAIQSKSDQPLFIHAHSRPWIDKNFQPHGNMLKGTYAAMAAILGGCDVLTIEEEDPNNKTMSREACNISNVLREESFLSKVSDPLAGSYFIEDLTQQLTESAWKKIQTHLPK